MIIKNAGQSLRRTELMGAILDFLNSFFLQKSKNISEIDSEAQK